MLRVRGLSKRFSDVAVFANVDLALAPGEFVALLGESGVGKSTLLNCIAGLETPTTGHIHLAGQDLAALDETARAHLRRDHIGFVFQAFHVLPHLTVAQNVSLPLRLQGRPFEEPVHVVLQALGLVDLAQRMPAQLSGGQLQRVAMARAVVHGPGLILADEPTGNLDPDTAERVLDALAQQVQRSGAACLLVTHSAPAARRAHRVCRLTAHGITS